MYQFVKSLTPEQWALIAGAVAPVVQYLLGKVKQFTSTHNWLLSFGLPLLGTVATYLSTNASFGHLLPLYATVYTTAQAVYFTTVKWWRAYESAVKVNQVATPVRPLETSF